MVHADQVPDMVDVVRDLGQRRRRPGVLRLPGGERLVDRFRIVAVHAREAGLLAPAPLDPETQLLRDVGAEEGDHDHASVVLEAEQHIVRDVAHVPAEGEGGRVREDDRGLAHVEGVVHRRR